MPKSLTPFEELAQTVIQFHGRGWCPASGCNFLFRPAGDPNFWISKPFVDKAYFTLEDLPVSEKGAKTPEETLIHAWIYNHMDMGAVLHTRSVSNEVISLAHKKDHGFWLEGHELLKSLDGIASHQARIFVPIFHKAPDIKTLCAEIAIYERENKGIPAILIAGHGLYCWGKSIAEAKRHTEIFEFLFECSLKMKGYEKD